MSDIYLGDCREIRSAIPDNSVDTIITDPPYGLEFMGKGWDKGVPGVEFWKEFLAVTKPGGMLLAFGGTRTFHRMTAAIEDAGWEIRDCMMWLYGSGFPKSLDISKAIDKAKGAQRTVVGPHVRFGESKARTGLSSENSNDGYKRDSHSHVPMETARREPPPHRKTPFAHEIPLPLNENTDGWDCPRPIRGER